MDDFSTIKTDADRFRQQLLHDLSQQIDRRDPARTGNKRRQHPRADLSVNARLRIDRQTNFVVRLENLSAGGCCVDFGAVHLSVGDAVSFLMDGIESWAGTVRWTDNSLLGIEFDRPLYPAVFEHLANGPRMVRQKAAGKPQSRYV